MKFLLKTNDGRERRPNFTIFVVWSADYASAKNPVARGERLIIQILRATGRILFTCF